MDNPLEEKNKHLLQLDEIEWLQISIEQTSGSFQWEICVPLFELREWNQEPKEQKDQKEKHIIFNQWDSTSSLDLQTGKLEFQCPHNGALKIRLDLQSCHDIASKVCAFF
jgi:hypothetical protein